MKRLVLVVVLASLSVFAARASAAGAAQLSLNFSATGTPGIVSASYAGFQPATVTTGDATSFNMSTHQPANICRTYPAGSQYACPAGYPNWGAHLTITGLEAAGLTFTGNGDTSAGCTQTNLDTVTCNYPYFNNYNKADHFYFTETGSASGGSTVNVNVQVYDKTLTDAPPTSKDQCKQGGWATFNTLSFTPISGTDGLYPAFSPVYQNQGTCVSYVNGVNNGG